MKCKVLEPLKFLSDCWNNKHLFKLSEESIKGNFSSLPIKCEFDSRMFLSVAKEKDGIFYHWMQLLGKYFF